MLNIAQKNMWMRSQILNKDIILRHVLAWGAIILFVWFNNPVTGGVISVIFSVIFFVGNFVINHYALRQLAYPAFYKKQYFTFFILFGFISCFFVAFDYVHLNYILPFFNGKVPRGSLGILQFTYRSLMLYGYLVFVAIGGYLGYRGILQTLEKVEKEKNTISRELVFLKNQFNSHLTFNFLNYCYLNMSRYSMALAAPLDNFTDMLHYSFNNRVNDFVSLNQEIEYIENFIIIQKALSNLVYVETHYEGDFNGYFLLPLLLGVFIENSFKHGVFNDSENPITISVSAKNEHIYFHIKNRKSNSKTLSSTGIGIINTQKILDIFYPNAHDIKINQTEEIYSCKIQIQNKF
jgi:two-component system LytT family sensor kinase